MGDDLTERQKEFRELLDRDTRSERAKNIMEHPKLMDSIENADPIWNELFKCVNNTHRLIDEDELTIQQKAQIVHNRLNSDRIYEGL